MTIEHVPGKNPTILSDSLHLWDQVANRYTGDQSSGKSFHDALCIPVIDTMIGDVRNKVILDAGCGNGAYAKKLASIGATVIGIDGSSEMIRLAQRDNSHPSVTYTVMNLTKPLNQKSSSVDIIVSSMVLMDLPEIENCIKEFARILRNDGLIIISITHPAFFSSEWAREESTPRAYKKVGEYLQEKCELLHFWGKTLHFHRPLSSYFNVLEKCGICVLSLEEPIPVLSTDESDPCLLCHQRIPSFLVMKAGMRKITPSLKEDQENISPD